MIRNSGRKRATLSGLAAVGWLTLLVACGGAGSFVSRRQGPPATSSTAEALFATTGAGIGAFSIDPSTGTLTLVPNQPFAAGAQPTWLALHPSGNSLFSVNDVANTPNVLTFSIDSVSRALTLTSTTTFPGPPGFITVDPTGTNAYVVSDGNTRQRLIAAYSIASTTHVLAILPNSPIATLVFPHGIAMDPLGRFVYVLGAAQVDVFLRNTSTGAIAPVAGSPFPVTTFGTQSFGIAVVPSGAFVLVPIFDANSIAVLAVNGSTGVLSQVAGSPFATGTAPVAVAADPTGQFVYVLNQGTTGGNGSVSSFTITTSGVLTPIGAPVTTGPSPSAIVVDPAGQFVYVGGPTSTSLNGYTINPISGALTPLTASQPAVSGPVHNMAILPAAGRP